MPLIDVLDLNKKYGNKQVLQNLTLGFEAGRVVGLLGPNGCGKSTLLKILAGLIADYSGQVLLAGQPPGIDSRAFVSFLPERPFLSDWMRPVDACALFADFYTDFDRHKAQELLEVFRLDGRQKIKTMSKGMQEKMQLALVLARQARVYLLDEPMGGVDPASRSAILEAIKTYYPKEALVLFATHLIYDVEDLFDEVVFLGFGELILQGTADQIRSQYGKSIDALFREVFA